MNEPKFYSPLYSDVEPYEGPLISADGHILEPRNLWVERMDRKWRDIAPHIAPYKDRGDHFWIEGMKPRPLAFEGPMADAKAMGVEITDTQGYSWDDCRPGGWDPHERLKDQDIDGVSGEVIYPTAGIFFGNIKDPEYELAAIRVYNDFAMEFCNAYPDRLKCMAMLPISGPPEWATDEIDRCLKGGAAGFMLPAWSPARQYNLAIWDPVWARLEEAGKVATFHLGGDTSEIYGRSHGPGAGGIVCAVKPMINETMQQIIWGGAADRFPKMRWSMCEGGVGWIACALGYMDHWWNDHKGWMQPKLEQPPSFYFRRNFIGTFEDDESGLLTRDLIGVENLHWGADYPHTEGVWPFSRQFISKQFSRILSPEETHKIVFENAAKTFGFPMQQAAY
ncbi:MAG: amidohydrolase [Gammaproteobacteria bacterium]|nr:amidohydrolase [Gammaproteobacteria bacterium]